MPIDPVCGMDVDKDTEHKTKYQAETYYFCSSDCKEEFERFPQDYVGNEGMESTGT